VVAAAIYFIAHEIAAAGWPDLLMRIAAVRPSWIAGAAACMVVRFLLLTERWHLALLRSGTTSRRLPGLAMVMAAAFVNHVTPTARLAGGLLRSRYATHRAAARFGDLWGSVLYDQLAHHVVTGAITWLSVGVLLQLLGHTRLAMVAMVALVATFFLLVVRRSWIRVVAQRALKWLAERKEGRGRLGAVVGEGRRALGVAGELVRDLRLWRWSAGLGVASFGLLVAAQWAVLRGQGNEAGVLDITLAVALGTAAGLVLATPGGAGTTEAGMIATYVALGVSGPAAVAGTLVFRALHYLLVLGLGLPALLVLERGSGRRPGRLGREGAGAGDQQRRDQ
jgi:uncharacterized protein (TIRG00374 family)